MAEEAGRAAAAAARALSARYLGMGTPGGICGRSGEAWDASAALYILGRNAVYTVFTVRVYSGVNRYVFSVCWSVEHLARCMPEVNIVNSYLKH